MALYVAQLLLALCMSPNARASYTLNVVQSGANVVATGSGSLNLAALGNGGDGIAAPKVNLSFISGCCFSPLSLIAVGSTAFADAYNGITTGHPIMGPSSFGSGPEIDASSGSGSLVTLISAAYLEVPSGYRSGSDLGTSTATWNNQTIVSLGLIVGTYVYTWGSGASADSFTLNIGLIGSMPQVVAEENWTTAFTLINKGTGPAQVQLNLFGDPSGTLQLPLALPQHPASGTQIASSIDQNIAANASFIVATAGPQNPPVQIGSAQLWGTGALDGFAIFHQTSTAQEAVVPLETRNASSYLLAFDNTGGLALGVALANVSTQSGNVRVVIRDDAGAQIGTGMLAMPANGHTSFVLSDPTNGFPVTANKRGTVEFDTPPNGQISVLGLRFTPPNNALTTIPALANVGTGGGSIAHLVSGGDGWQTTFVLINSGTSAANFTLNFFADPTGAPLSLPLSFPQSGTANLLLSNSVTQTLAAGATLIIVSSGAPDLLTGSAQLSTAGSVSGFVIFRHNGQEAVVPMESRSAIGYIIAFDNTNGTAKGIAVNAVSTQQVNVPVVVRDDTGAQIASDTLTLGINGHYSFTLVTDRYPATANIRGTIEFDTPAGAQIGALGIRIPAGAAHTYTTLPALTKEPR